MAETYDKKNSETPEVEEKPKEKAPTPAEVFTPEVVAEKTPEVKEPAKKAAPDTAAELETMRAQIAELSAAKKASDKEKADMERQLTANTVADRYGLSSDAREFLTGNTEDALEESAKKLAALVSSAPVIGKGGLTPGGSQERSLNDLSPAELAARIPKTYF
ncbi:hypothetical protein ACN20G_29850 (plasmid) [Streptomyces sp. BI20]|uniref:hypothetical protein n=1 Tax=Streptomyces sp. BI20 TaxID=3403460 RepID=UPI003C781DD2